MGILTLTSGGEVLSKIIFSILLSYAIFSRCLSNVPLKKFQPNNSEQVLNYVKLFLPEKPIIIEAGAYDGQDSLYISKIFPNALLYAFEPVPELYLKLYSTVEGNPHITAVPYALSDKTGNATFYLSVINDVPESVSSSSSLLPPNFPLEKYAPHVSFPSRIEVKAITIDDWARNANVDHIDFLWLDMQGYELNTLMASDLAKNALVIWTEVEFIEAYKDQYLFKDVLKWMHENNFELVGSNVDVFNLPSNSCWGDALFIKKTLFEHIVKSK